VTASGGSVTNISGTTIKTDVIREVNTVLGPCLCSITLYNTDVSMTSLDGDIVVVTYLKHMPSLTRPLHIALGQKVVQSAIWF
jgi:hypothetical protein